MNPQNAADLYRMSPWRMHPRSRSCASFYAGAIRSIALLVTRGPCLLCESVHRVAIAERAVSRARFEHNPEVSSQLEQLYLYVEGTLARATIERSVEPLRDARAVLERLADAWNHAGISAGETE